MEDGRQIFWVGATAALVPIALLALACLSWTTITGQSFDLTFFLAVFALFIALVSLILALFITLPTFGYLSSQRWLNPWTALLTGLAQGVPPIVILVYFGERIDGRFSVEPITAVAIEALTVAGCLSAWWVWRRFQLIAQPRT